MKGSFFWDLSFLNYKWRTINYQPFSHIILQNFPAFDIKPIAWVDKIHFRDVKLKLFNPIRVFLPLLSRLNFSNLPTVGKVVYTRSYKIISPQHPRFLHLSRFFLPFCLRFGSCAVPHQLLLYYVRITYILRWYYVHITLHNKQRNMYVILA